MENGIPYSTGQIETLKRAAISVGLDFDLKSLGLKMYLEDIFNK